MIMQMPQLEAPFRPVDPPGGSWKCVLAMSRLIMFSSCPPPFVSKRLLEEFILVNPKVGISHFLHLSSISRDFAKTHYLIILTKTKN